ncbi:MAG TPA: hypothetical protein VGH25_14340, partial [Dongiaceae bacterium]
VRRGLGRFLFDVTLLGSALRGMTAVFQRARTILLYPPGLVERAARPPRLDQAGGAMVLNQPALQKAIWRAVVAKMIHIYKVAVAEDEVGPIVDYLAGLKPAN